MTASPFSTDDHHWMQTALHEAKQAAAREEVPVGAVLVADSVVLGSGGNRPIRTSDPTAHAEIVALRRAGQRLNNYRLTGTTLYVTLEPCIMCMGAILLARVDRLVFGATDPKSGAAISRYQIGTDDLLNHTLLIDGGLLKDECSQLITSFFRARRRP